MTKVTNKSVKLSKKQEAVLKRNEEFKKLTPAQKRVQIAKDVIKSLKSEFLEAKCGSYCDIGFEPTNNVIRKIEEYSMVSYFEPMGIQLQDLIVDKSVISCSVCAIGALFISKVKLLNKFKVTISKYDINYINDRNTFVDNLKGLFSTQQLTEIEFAFEGYCYDSILGYSEKFSLYTNFYDSYEQDSDRMIAIMKNIIKNNGTFKL